MKKGIFAKSLFFCLLMLSMQSNAEIRITPDSTTSPDSSSSIHLHDNRSSNPGNYGPDGAVISGVNHDGSSINWSAGGFFMGNGPNGAGVMGVSWDSNGVWGIAHGEDGVAVSGFATYAGGGTNYGGRFEAGGTTGRGVQGIATGTECIGVYGFASNEGNVTNSGGYFVANGSTGKGVQGYGKGSNGIGVYGKATNDGYFENYGGYFEALGTYAKGVYSYAPGEFGTAFQGLAMDYGGYFAASGAGGKGVYGYAPGSSGKGVEAWGQKCDFYAAGPGSNYLPFTGAHEVKFEDEIPEVIVPGLIVSSTGKTEARKDKNGKICLSSTLPTVALSTKVDDKAVFGVIVSDGPLPKDHWHESQEGEHFGVVNALGEGRVWVTNRNGNIENGDYITTSEIPGYGQRQDDDLLHSYTLGKAIETIDWEYVNDTVEYEGKSHKRYLIAVVYTSG